MECFDRSTEIIWKFRTFSEVRENKLHEKKCQMFKAQDIYNK